MRQGRKAEQGSKGERVNGRFSPFHPRPLSPFSIPGLAPVAKETALFLVVLVASLFLVACHRAEFPAIKDGAMLRIECGNLMNQFSGGEIPPTNWPRSVKDLKPIRVVREPDAIRIFTHARRGKFTGGYCVFLDSQLTPSTQGVWIQKTEFKGVYIFKRGY